MAEAATARQSEVAANTGGSADAAASWAHVMPLPCQLTVDLPVLAFKVADALRLEPESIVATNCPVGADVPLLVNGELVAWGDFEVTGNRLLARVTELA